MLSLLGLFSVAVIFLAAIVRGFSGFGFSLLAVSALTLLSPPSEVVPTIFLLEVAASLHLLPSIWKDVQWRSLMPLILGCGLATPVGAYALATLPASPMQIALSLFVLVSVVFLWSGFTLKKVPSTAATMGIGAASGLFNGALAMGGPPVIVFYFASPIGMAAGRASLIGYILATDTLGLASLAWHGLITRDALLRAALFLPALLAGVWLGARGFKSVNEVVFRKIVLIIMAVLAPVGGVKALLG